MICRHCRLPIVRLERRATGRATGWAHVVTLRTLLAESLRLGVRIAHRAAP